MEAALKESLSEMKLRVLYDEEGVWQRHLEKLNKERLARLENFKEGVGE